MTKKVNRNEIKKRKKSSISRGLDAIFTAEKIGVVYFRFKSSMPLRQKYWYLFIFVHENITALAIIYSCVDHVMRWDCNRILNLCFLFDFVSWKKMRFRAPVSYFKGAPTQKRKRDKVSKLNKSDFYFFQIWFFLQLKDSKFNNHFNIWCRFQHFEYDMICALVKGHFMHLKTDKSQLLTMKKDLLGEAPTGTLGFEHHM